MIELLESQTPEAVIKVVGVGGCGGNAVDHMINNGVQGVEFITMNTDAQALKRNLAKVTLQLDLGLVALQSLCIRVGGDEFHPLHALVDHVIDRVAAAAAHANHLDYGFLRLCVHYLEHSCLLFTSTDAITRNFP